MRQLLVFCFALLLGLVVPVAPVTAQDSGSLEDNLSAYVGDNAEGYLGPLRDGIGGTLNSGLFMYPGVPSSGFHFRLDARAMIADYNDEDRTFLATTDPSFGDNPQTVEVPTVIGSTESITVSDPTTGAIYTFPGGFDIGQLGLAAPQITVGSFFGTEFLGRWIAVEPGDLQVQKLELWGIGARHSINEWFRSLPVDISIHGMYQEFKVDEDLIDATTLSLGGVVGKSFGILAGYAGLSYNSVEMDARYVSDASGQSEEVTVQLEKQSNVDLGLGATVKFGFLHLNGEYHIAERNSYALGIGLGL